MKQSLAELVQYIRQALPQPKAISHLQENEGADVVTFRWHGREFLVKKSLEVLELKGRTVYLTGASALLQVALMKRSKHEKVIEEMISVLQEAEEMIGSRYRSEAGLKLLELVKGNLTRLAGGRAARASATQLISR